MWSNSVAKEKLDDKTMGQMLGSRMSRYCKVPDTSGFSKKYKSVPPEAESEVNSLVHGKGNDLGGIFAINPEKFAEHFLYNSYLPINWVYLQ